MYIVNNYKMIKTKYFIPLHVIIYIEVHFYNTIVLWNGNLNLEFLLKPFSYVYFVVVDS